MSNTNCLPRSLVWVIILSFFTKAIVCPDSSYCGPTIRTVPLDRIPAQGRPAACKFLILLHYAFTIDINYILE